ncbi:hypothetical protein Tco_1214007 [Tanacetum coccineum]
MSSHGITKKKARSSIKGKDIGTGLDLFSAAKEKVNSAEVEVNTGRVEVNPGSAGVNTGSTPVSTPCIVQKVNVIVPSPDKGQREGKAQMIDDDIQATQKTKEQIRKEEAGLAEAIRLQAQLDEEAARQVHLDALLAKRIKEEQELSRQQQKRKAEVQEATYDDFAKRMVDMINQKKKYYAEQKAKARRNKPMTQEQKKRAYRVPSSRIKSSGKWLVEEAYFLKSSSWKFEKCETTQHEAEEDMEAIEKDNVINSSSGTDIPVSAVLVAIKPPSIANWKIIKLDYIDPVWNLPYQQKILSWRYYDTCRVHCLTLESADIYMLTERRYPLPADVCQAMLDKKLQGDNRDKACYQLLKLIEKQAQNKLP